MIDAELKTYIDSQIARAALKAQAEIIIWVKSKVATVRSDPTGRTSYVAKDLEDHKKAYANGFYQDIVNGNVEKFGLEQVMKLNLESAKND